MATNEKLTPVRLSRLEQERNIWLASMRPGGRPHLVPIWFIWHLQRLYICISSTSVKAINMRDQPAVSLALENGSDVLICEGEAELIPEPWAGELRQKFQLKYDWDIVTDEEYDQLWCITPRKWLAWGDN